MSGRSARVLACALAMTLAGCSSDKGSSAETSSTSTLPATSVPVAANTTSAATSAVPATESPLSTPPTEPVATIGSTLSPPSTGCPESATIPSDATNLASINGDIDGDTMNDVVTAYSLDGVPHVHAALATGGNSDTEVPIGNADTVSIQFLDFDHSLGAAVPPPLAVLAIGPTKAGTAIGAFLTLTPQYCIRVWRSNTTDDTLFTFRISAEEPYQGLECDGAAGSINHSLTTAQQDPGGDWAVTIQPFGHNFTTVELHDVQNQTVPDDPDIQHQFGDLTSCGITLFP